MSKDGQADSRDPTRSRQLGLTAMDLGLLGENVGPTIRLLRNLLSARIVAAFEPHGLRSGSFSTMALIAANPDCSQSDIARQIGADKSIVVAIVDELERRGLAERRRSTQDRRRNALRLTDAGRSLMAELDAIGRAVEQPIRAALGEEGVAQLILLGRGAVAALLESEPG